MFKKMVADYLAGNYINIDNLPAATVTELHKLQQDQRTQFQAAVDSALNEWASVRPRKKS